MGSDPIFERKGEVRREMRERLRAITPDERKLRSREAAARLERLAEWASARAVLLFRSLPTEVDTEPILRRSLERGQAVFAPRLHGGRLQFLRVSETTVWERASLGALEPRSGEPLTLREYSFGETVVLVPGVAFTPSGERLGRGGGHYDRALATPPLAANALTIGLAFELQIIRDVPVEAHDIRVKLLVTDERVIRPGSTEASR